MVRYDDENQPNKVNIHITMQLFIPAPFHIPFNISLCVFPASVCSLVLIAFLLAIIFLLTIYTVH